MRIEPFFSASGLMTSFLVSDEQTAQAVFVNLGEVSGKMISRLTELQLKTVLICDNRSQVLRNIDILQKIFPFLFHDFSKDRVYRLGGLEIELIGHPSVFRINDTLFIGNTDITDRLDDLDPDLAVLPSQAPVSTVRELVRLRDSRLERAILPGNGPAPR